VRTIRDHTRATDVIARLGGDEFIILFPETGFETAQAVINKVRASLREVMDSHHWPVTFSFGMVTFQMPPSSVEQLLKIADNTMYGVKNSGKNNVRFNVFSK
jgi:diguanylate cyclase (GGDEF)-like protein